ncbi:MAG: hypothetical protein ABII09_12660 [Planctomycetota bacterium]
MEWKIDYLEKDGIVSVKTSGPANWDQTRKMCEEALALGRSNGSHRFLVDHQQIEHGLTILQVDDLPGMFKQIGVTAEDKIAILFNPAPKMSEAFAFFRDTSFLASLQVRLFTETGEAIAWLKSDGLNKP